MYFTYILQNSRGHLYKGITDNLDRRIKEHNSNKCIGTRGKGSWELVYYESYSTRQLARQREKYFKSGIGREELNKLVVK